MSLEEQWAKRKVASSFEYRRNEVRTEAGVAGSIEKMRTFLRPQYPTELGDFHERENGDAAYMVEKSRGGQRSTGAGVKHCREGEKKNLFGWENVTTQYSRRLGPAKVASAQDAMMN